VSTGLPAELLVELLLELLLLEPANPLELDELLVLELLEEVLELLEELLLEELDPFIPPPLLPLPQAASAKLHIMALNSCPGLKFMSRLFLLAIGMSSIFMSTVKTAPEHRRSSRIYLCSTARV
jgi:hypothetical protein